MMKTTNLFHGIGVLLAGLIASQAPADIFNPYDEMSGQAQESWLPAGQPGKTAEQAIGFYSDGELQSASHLPDEGFGFVKIARPRDRAWGARELISVIENSAADVAQAYPEGERLQVGDLSARHGGRISLHASHQNGLDVDFAYYRRNHYEQSPDHTRGFEEVFVRKGRLTSNFDLERNWALIRALVENGRINRIFVDPVIKEAMCDNYLSSSTAHILRRLRPLGHHADHLHVRLKCPEGSTQCRDQNPPPRGSGC